MGIPEEIPGKPEVSQTIQHVLRFGGRISHHGRAYPVGRFGFGLSQTVYLPDDKIEGLLEGRWRVLEGLSL